jgi:hypothetical protein
MESANVSRTASRWPAPTIAEVGTQTLDPNQDHIQFNFMDPRNESLAKIMPAYREKEYEKLLAREKVLESRRDLDQQKTIELHKRISTLISAIEKIKTKGASLVKELASDLTSDERRAMERDFDVLKARKRKELEYVIVEHTQRLQRITEQAHDIVTVWKEQDAFMSNAKTHIKDAEAARDSMNAVLKFLNGLPACRISV